MNQTLPYVPDGYRAIRQLSVRSGSWVFLATNPSSGWCCLKIQQVARFDSLETLVEIRHQLYPLCGREGLLPVVNWGVDNHQGVLWEELPLADNLLLDGAFVPEQHETYTPLTLGVWLNEHGPASTSMVIEWGLQLAAALATLHQASLLHRDPIPGRSRSDWQFIWPDPNPRAPGRTVEILLPQGGRMSFLTLRGGRIISATKRRNNHVRQMRFRDSWVRVTLGVCGRRGR